MAKNDKGSAGGAPRLDRAPAERALEAWRKRIIDSCGADLPVKEDLDALVAAGIDRALMMRKLQKATQAARVQSEIQTLQAQGMPLSMVAPAVEGGAVPLWSMRTPSKGWTVLIDETGDVFDSDDVGTAVGKFAALVVPDGCELPEFADFHAAEAPPMTVDAVIRALLERPVGVFGLDVSASEAKTLLKNVWIQGVLEIVHWCLRLIPLGDEATRVSFLVEQKGSFRHSEINLATTLEEIRRSLAQQHPARASRIGIAGMRFVDKSEKRMAFVDALAHTFAARRQDARVRVRVSGLSPALVTKASVTTRDYDRVMAADDIAADVWQKLVRQGAALHPLGSLLLKRMGERCRGDVTVWRELMALTAAGLEHPKRNLNLVGRELRWLEACRPPGEDLEAGLELVWTTVALAESNHRGEVELARVETIRELGDSLIDEEVRLVAEAELHAAVMLTNSFDFAGAARVMKRWHGAHRRELGRNLFGRVLSTHGQHEAFAGRNARAVEYFNRAVAEFQGMSNKDDAARELKQTRSYRGFALMDLQVEQGLDAQCAALLRDDIEFLAGPARQLSRSGDIRFGFEEDGPTAYQWHFFFRYLATFHNKVPAGDLSKMPPMCDEDMWQWPWPMIQTYCASRYWLHGDIDNARKRLKHAVQLARAEPQGPTVRAIAVAVEMAAEAAGWGIVPDRAAKQALEREVPAAFVRFRAVSLTDDFVSNLRHLLPFNFR